MYRSRLMDLVAVMTLLVVAVGCGGGDEAATTEAAETTIAPTTTAPTTTTTSTTTTTLPPIGTPFTTDAVLEVPGMPAFVGDGYVAVEMADEEGMINIFVNGTVPVEDGKTCMQCMGRLSLDGGVAVAVEGLFRTTSSQGVSVSINNMALTGPMLPESSELFIVAGPEGARLEKVGSGFRLIEGAAWLVTDRSLIESG